MKRWPLAAVLLSVAFGADNRLSPEEAKAYGIIDEIIEKRRTPNDRKSSSAQE